MGKVGAAVGVALGAVLALMMGLLVFAGSDADRTPGLSGVVCAPAGGAPGDPVAGFADSQLANAAAIVAAGVEIGAPQRAHVIAVATAMQESSLFIYANSTVAESLQVPHERVGSDHDSVGLFQQRASWGSVTERMDAKTSALLFYEQLLALPGWESLSLTVAAQRVQISAFPDAYSRWEQPANEVVGSVAGIGCGTPGGVVAPNPNAQLVIDRALSELGTPYVWGGGDSDGPTGGGYDCSGLMMYAFAGTAGVPHQTQAIWAAFQPAITDPSQILPGDMILYSDNGQANGIHHVGLYLGEGRMVHAPQTGKTVELVEGIWDSPYRMGEFIGAVRPTPAAPAP